MSLAPGEQPFSLRNLIGFVVSRPRSLPVLIGKVLKRRTQAAARYTALENRDWIAHQAIVPEAFARERDAALWVEATAYSRTAQTAADHRLADVDFEIGGGADHTFLYWLTRFLQPETIVETGVAAGWSSRAFLSAVAANGKGRLYSSDFPYFRVRDPERYIGLVVEPELKRDWRLFLVGDEVALPSIGNEVKQVDLFHYDSDKSFAGRAFGIRWALEKLAAGGVIVMDDISDNSWFREFVEDRKMPFAIFDQRFGVIDPSGRLGLRS